MSASKQVCLGAQLYNLDTKGRGLKGKACGGTNACVGGRSWCGLLEWVYTQW
jgi:hypothetical protein